MDTCQVSPPLTQWE